MADVEIPDKLNLTDLKAESCKRSLYKFVKEFWSVIIPEDMVDNWHIKYLCDEIQAVGQWIINRQPKEYDLVINISAGTTKSTIASVMFPAWLWANDPTLRTITGSHGAGLALDLAVKARDVIRSEKYQRYYPNVQIKADSDNKSSYSTTKGGGRVSTSVGGGVIGKHAHCIIVDDPTKVDPSPQEIQKANKWITNDLATRKVDKKNTPTILIMQRVADNDPSAHMLSKVDDVKHICLPAEQTPDIKPSYLSKHYEHGLMDTKRLDHEVLADMKVRLGSYGYSAQFLQNPQPTGGGIIKQDWISPIPLTPDLSDMLSSVPTNFYLDTAYTEDVDNNDPSGLIATKKIGDILYILYATEVWKEFNEFVNWLPQFLDNWEYSYRSKIYIEPKASGKSVTSYLQKQTHYNVIEDKPPSESKDARLRGISPKIEAQKVQIIQGGWNENYISQLCNPKPAHDDLRDCTVMAIRNELIENASKGVYNYR